MARRMTPQMRAAVDEALRLYTGPGCGVVLADIARKHGVPRKRLSAAYYRERAQKIEHAQPPQQPPPPTPEPIRKVRDLDAEDGGGEAPPSPFTAPPPSGDLSELLGIPAAPAPDAEQDGPPEFEGEVLETTALVPVDQEGPVTDQEVHAKRAMARGITKIIAVACKHMGDPMDEIDSDAVEYGIAYGMAETDARIPGWLLSGGAVGSALLPRVIKGGIRLWKWWSGPPGSPSSSSTPAAGKPRPAPSRKHAGDDQGETAAPRPDPARSHINVPPPPPRTPGAEAPPPSPIAPAQQLETFS